MLQNCFVESGITNCDPFCQNETLLFTWSKLSSWYINIHLPLVMVAKILKSDNPIAKLCPFDFGVVKSMKWRNWLSKFGVYQMLDQLSFRLDIIKITPFRWTLLIKFYAFKTCKQLWKKLPQKYFQLYLHIWVLHRSFGSCTEVSHFDRMDHNNYLHDCANANHKLPEQFAGIVEILLLKVFFFVFFLLTLE